MDLIDLARRPEMSPGYRARDEMGLHAEVTKRIVAQLEAGTAPWVKPWATPMPYNATTSRRYRGVNVLLLWNTPYERPAWLTFQQAQVLRGDVRKGERATQIVYDSSKLKPSNDTEGRVEKVERYSFLTRYFVPAAVSIQKQRHLREHGCWWYRKYAPGDTVLEGLERDAREARKGLWVDPLPVPPWEWRTRKER